MRTLFVVLLLLVLGLTARAQNSKVVTAAQANGVYRSYKSELRIVALGHNRFPPVN